MRVLSITALLLATASPAFAEPSVEVMHFWTSRRRGRGPWAPSATRSWPKASPGPTRRSQAAAAMQAKTALQARIASGNPPAAMLMLGQTITDWAAEGMLGNVDALAEAQGWDAALPQAVKDFTKIDGHYVSVPTNVHRTDMIWASKAAFDKIGAAYPTTWEELNALAPKFVEAGIIPLAHGGQAWQEAYMFEAVAAGRRRGRVLPQGADRPGRRHPARPGNGRRFRPDGRTARHGRPELPRPRLEPCLRHGHQRRSRDADHGRLGQGRIHQCRQDCPATTTPASRCRRPRATRSSIW